MSKAVTELDDTVQQAITRNRRDSQFTSWCAGEDADADAEYWAAEFDLDATLRERKPCFIE